MIYDCTPPAEPVTHAIVRHLHNILHPHHKRQFAPLFHPKPELCGTPELETVTVTAPVLPPDASLPPEVTAAGYGGGLGFYPETPPLYGAPVYVAPPRAVSVPEPAPLWLLAPAVLFIVLRRRVRA